MLQRRHPFLAKTRHSAPGQARAKLHPTTVLGGRLKWIAFSRPRVGKSFYSSFGVQCPSNCRTSGCTKVTSFMYLSNRADNDSQGQFLLQTCGRLLATKGSKTEIKLKLSNYHNFGMFWSPHFLEDQYKTPGPQAGTWRILLTEIVFWHVSMGSICVSFFLNLA